MLTSIIVRIVGFCIRHAWTVVGVGLLIAAGSSVYTASHFRLNSDINALLSDKLDWRKRDIAFESAFGRFGIIDVVVEAPTPELTGAATVELTQALAKEKAQFPDVSNIGATEFFAQHGLLFLPKPALEKALGGLIQGEALIEDLASDRSLRGLIAGLEDVLLGLQSNRVKLDDLGRPLNQASDTLDNVLAGRPASFSWRVLVQGKPAAPNDLRGFIEVHPALDFSALQPGLRASETIRRIAADVLPKYQASMRLTGVVTMNDEQFGTIKENAVRNALITLAIVAFILWLALRSGRLMAAIAVNLFVGLAVTAALGLLMVGAYNLISVYFSVLFVGIGVDFGIQFSVRYRSERHDIGDLVKAIQSAGFRIGAPLTLAAFATAAGFLSFLPTDYKGVSELGQIAGWHAGRFRHHHHASAGADPPAEPARRTGAARLFVARAGRRLYESAPDRNHRRHGDRRDRWLAAAPLAQLRLQSDQSAESQNRVDRDLSRAQSRCQHRRQRHPGAGAVARTGECDRRATLEAPGGVACRDALELHSGGSGGKAPHHSKRRG
jgi:hopanoid biosynthesis associated RND transporter like protein HpnN